MEDLMTAVFIAHTKVLTAVGIANDRKKKLSISVPKLDHFLHRVFREAARCFWKTPFLFMETGGVVDRQKNILQIEALANEALATAVRSMLPVKQILKDYLDGDQEEIEEDEVVPAVAPTLSVSETEETTSSATSDEETNTGAATATAASGAATETNTPLSTETTTAPSVLNIDTEPAVRFSDYDAVFDETQGAPELRYSPKDAISHSMDDEDDYDGPSDGALQISGDVKELSIGDDFEDLEAPAKVVVPAPKKDDALDVGDFEVLE
jgi:hypothetical protein